MNTLKEAMPQQRLTPAKGFAALLCVIAVITAFIFINLALDINNYWPGFLFVLYWAAVDHARMDRLLPDAAGSLIGVLLAYGLMVMQDLGVAVTIVVLFFLVSAIYCTIMSWLPLFINTATMLFLTVSTIPAISSHVPFKELSSALVLGILFFGLIGTIGYFIAKRKNRLLKKTA